MQSKVRKIVVVVGILSAVLLVGACKKKVATPPPPPPPPPTPPAPTVTLTAEPSTIERGQSVTLSWTSENATDLDLQPGIGKVQAQGSQTATPQDSTTFTLTATGPGGNNAATARVTVTMPPPPPPPPPAKPVELSEEQLFEQAIKSELLHPVHVDIAQSNYSYTVHLEVPGFTVKDLEIGVEPHRLTISGKREASEERKSKRTIYTEHCVNQIFRKIDLPAEADSSTLHDMHSDG